MLVKLESYVNNVAIAVARKKKHLKSNCSITTMFIKARLVEFMESFVNRSHLLLQKKLNL